MNDNDRRVLTLGDEYHRHYARKMTLARETTGYSEVGFWARFDHLIDTAEAQAEMPAVCRRGRVLRERRRAVRSTPQVANR